MSPCASIDMRRCVAILLLLGLSLTFANAQEPGQHAFDLPPWFSETLLDFRDDAAEAARSGKRLLVYFGQDGCPYCKELLQTNFSQKRIVEKTRRHFVAIALNIWGDREVVWLDGRAMSEKDLARELKVQFTPTVLFMDHDGGVVARLNGYWPPHRFESVLDYVSGRREKKGSLTDYLAKTAKSPARATLNEQPFFMRSTDLARRPGARPLVVVFETRQCAGCDELHREGFRRKEIVELLKSFDAARFALSDRAGITTPDGRPARADAWARELRVTYTPSLVFFGADGKEAHRIEGYLRPFHLARSFEYVATGAYRTQPSFQRFIQSRAEEIRAHDGKVELWK